MVMRWMCSVLDVLFGSVQHVRLSRHKARIEALERVQRAFGPADLAVRVLRGDRVDRSRAARP